MCCVAKNKLALAMVCTLIFGLMGCANTQGGNSGASCVAGNCYNGHGTWVYVNGGRYVGQWSNGKRNGQGTDYFANGDIYEGQFVNDARSGYGKLTFANGNIYTGQWANNKRNGQGRDEGSDGSVKEGNYIDDTIVRGKIKYMDGNNYTGEILTINGKNYRHGLGTLKWTNGGSYTGSFKRNEPDGEGVYTDVNGMQWDQVWQNGHQISAKERISSNSPKPVNKVVFTGNGASSRETLPIINNSKGNPDIHFDEFTISPERAKVGDKFQLTVRYTASDPEKGANESLPITFHYEIIIGGKSVYKSKSKTIQSPNNKSTFAVENLIIKAKKKGEYQIRVYLYYGESVGKMSKKTFVIGGNR